MRATLSDPCCHPQLELAGALASLLLAPSLRAFRAFPEKLERVPDFGEAMPPREIPLELCHWTILDQRNDPAALHAHEMIVVTAWIKQLEVTRRPAQVYAVHQPKHLELLHRPKNRGEIRPAAVMRRLFANFLEAQRASCREQRAQDRPAILRHPQAGTFERVDQVVERQ
jgi:hypothetical protein